MGVEGKEKLVGRRRWSEEMDAFCDLDIDMLEVVDVECKRVYKMVDSKCEFLFKELQN
jgi:hypothetical protein